MDTHTRLSAARVAERNNLGNVVPWLSHLWWMRRAAMGDGRWSVEEWGRAVTQDGTNRGVVECGEGQGDVVSCARSRGSSEGCGGVVG
jgi:hypothetical protein